MRTKGPTITQRQISIRAPAMPTTLTSRNMESRQAAEGAEVAPAKLSVRPIYAKPSVQLTNPGPGRVAAGAIAEKYLKIAYGIEIVAFVSSVGKVHLPATLAPPSLTPQNPDEDDDNAQDALSKDFIQLLSTITREEVDKMTTRCPHAETSERMTQVRTCPFTIRCNISHLPPIAHHPCQKRPGFHRRHRHLRYPGRPFWSRRACLRQIRSLACPCYAFYPRHQSV